VPANVYTPEENNESHMGRKKTGGARYATRCSIDVLTPYFANRSCACVTGLVDTLRPEYAAAIRHVDIDGVPVVQFARETGITPGNAGVRLHRAHAALRKQLALSCSTCAEHGCLDCHCSRSANHTKEKRRTTG